MADYDMIVNLKLIRSIMSEPGLHGLPHPPRRIPNLIRVNTPADLVNRQFTATRPNELWCTDITEHPARDGKVFCCAILDGSTKGSVPGSGVSDGGVSVPDVRGPSRESLW
ncbi:hypothetical protein MAHJHV63_25370 [Mycobacterium avium subsp. hominissuis]